MNTAPIEVIEQIIAYLPTEDLFSLCHTDRTLFKLSRYEAYKRWKQCAIKYGELFWEAQDLDKICNELERNNEPGKSPAWSILFRKTDDNRYNLKVIAEEQLLIMEKMKNHGMIVDEQEKEIINYNTITARYRSDRWVLHWSWCYANCRLIRYVDVISEDEW